MSRFNFGQIMTRTASSTGSDFQLIDQEDLISSAVESSNHNSDVSVDALNANDINPLTESEIPMNLLTSTRGSTTKKSVRKDSKPARGHLRLMIIGESLSSKTTLINSLLQNWYVEEGRENEKSTMPIDGITQSKIFLSANGSGHLLTLNLTEVTLGGSLNDIFAVNAIAQHLAHTFEQSSQGSFATPLADDKKLVRDFEGYAAVILMCTHGRLTVTELRAVKEANRFAPIIVVFGRADALQDDQIEQQKSDVVRALKDAGVQLYGQMDLQNGASKVASTVYVLSTQMYHQSHHDDNQLLENPMLDNFNTDWNRLRDLIFTRGGHRDLYTLTSTRNVTALDKFITWFHAKHQPKPPARFSADALAQYLYNIKASCDLTRRELLLVGVCAAVGALGAYAGYAVASRDLQAIKDSVEEVRASYLALRAAHFVQTEEILKLIKHSLYDGSLFVWNSSAEAARYMKSYIPKW